ncbi:MAG: hypothetical protein CME32_17695 [Gimesia sp.]|nr:hypothetical protein [Gimesia sp.]
MKEILEISSERVGHRTGRRTIWLLIGVELYQRSPLNTAPESGFSENISFQRSVAEKADKSNQMT